MLLILSFKNILQLKLISNNMKNINKILFAGLSFLSPLLIYAEKRDVVVSGDEIAYFSVFAGDFSLLLSTVIGIVATFFVFRAAGKMGGGLFGSILNYIAGGMVFVVLGAVSMFIDDWFPGLWFGVINTALFATGYILMVIGANKLLKGIINT